MDGDSSGGEFDLLGLGTPSVVSFTPGSVIFAGPSGVFAQDNANFFWNVAGQALRVVGDEILTGVLYGGTATADNLDIDPSSAANYTGSVRIATTASDYGSGSLRILHLWPNGLTHGGGVLSTIKALEFSSTLTIDANETLTLVAMVSDTHTTSNAAIGITTYPIELSFQASPTVRNAFAGAVTSTIVGYQFAPQLTNSGGGTLTVTSMVGYQSAPSAIPAGGTVTTLTHFTAVNVTATGTLTTHVGYDCTVNSGTTPISYRSSGALAQMRHLGPARFGSSTAGPTGSSILHIDGGLTGRRTTTGDANYTALTSDFIIEWTALTANRTLNLPAAATAADGKIYIVKKGTSAAFNIIIDPSGAETIDGVATVSITASFGSQRIYCTGTAWRTC